MMTLDRGLRFWATLRAIYGKNKVVSYVYMLRIHVSMLTESSEFAKMVINSDTYFAMCHMTHSKVSVTIYGHFRLIE